MRAPGGLMALAGVALFVGLEALGQQTTPANPPAGLDIPWNFLCVAALFGAIGGVVFELVALQGNIERPHWTTPGEIPGGGFPHAGTRFLLDLGIAARIIIGAAAAIILYAVLPMRTGMPLVALSIVAGSAGTAVFRSVQDRLLAALRGAQVERMADSVEDMKVELDNLLPDLPLAGARGTGAGPPPKPDGAAAGVEIKVAEIRGRMDSLLRLAGRRPGSGGPGAMK